MTEGIPKTVLLAIDQTEAAVLVDALRVYARTHIGPVVTICEIIEADLLSLTEIAL